MKFKCNLVADAECLCSAYLQNNGVKLKHKDDVLVDYLSFCLRRPCPKSRKIYKAKEFTCPSGYEAKLAYVENAITTGLDLAPFMTKSTEDLKKEDLLLNDWGIYHLHLNDEMEGSFVKRSSYLLLALISSETVYFIKCIPHPAAGDSLPWGLREYLEIIDANWPEYTDRWRINEDRNIELVQHFSEAEYVECRKAGICMPIELKNGKILLGPGGGVACDGSSVRAVEDSNALKKQLMRIPDMLNEFIDKGILRIETDLSEVDLKLVGMTPFREYLLLVGNADYISLYSVGNEFRVRKI